jgi:hypothetical protein
MHAQLNKSEKELAEARRAVIAAEAARDQALNDVNALQFERDQAKELLAERSSNQVGKIERQKSEVEANDKMTGKGNTFGKIDYQKKRKHEITSKNMSML